MYVVLVCFDHCSYVVTPVLTAEEAVPGLVRRGGSGSTGTGTENGGDTRVLAGGRGREKTRSLEPDASAQTRHHSSKGEWAA